MAEHQDYSLEVPPFDPEGAGPLPDPTAKDGITYLPGEQARLESLSDNLHRKWEVRLAEDHLCQTGVYLRRWRLETPWFSIRLHHWLGSDDNRAHHDHPWNFITFVLKGSYIDESPNGSQRCSAGHFYYRPAEHAHWVHLQGKSAWTLVLTGPKIRRWGFWDGGKWIKSFKYFYRRGNHPCDD